MIRKIEDRWPLNSGQYQWGGHSLYVPSYNVDAVHWISLEIWVEELWCKQESYTEGAGAIALKAAGGFSFDIGLM